MENYFLSLAALVPLIILATDFIVRWLKINAPTTKQIISWVVSVLLCLFAAWVDIGIFAGITFLKTVIYGFAAGLVANGVFDINVVQTILDLIFKFLPKKE